MRVGKRKIVRVAVADEARLSGVRSCCRFIAVKRQQVPHSKGPCRRQWNGSSSINE